MSMEQMKVIALGGCGGMGQFAVRNAVTFDFLNEIVIADINGERASAFTEKCGPKATSVVCDAEDSEALKKLLSDADVVLNMVGPFYRLGVPILRAAIEAKCHYIDINDDWEPTLEMLDLDEEARKAGITAIIGMGASPGISNMLAAKAVSHLDTVDELITGWGEGDIGEEDMGEPGEGGSFGAATEHWVHQFTGKIRVFRNGEYVDVPPLQKVKLDYPGVGRVTTYTVGHPEPITLPRFWPEIKNSCNVMNFSPQIIAILRWLSKQVENGRMSIRDASNWLENLMESDTKNIFISKLGPRLLWAVLQNTFSPTRNLKSLFAVAKGTSAGKKAAIGATVTSWPTGGLPQMTMGAITGIPTAIALAMFAKGSIKKQGVFAPEGIINPDTFFDELAPFCTPVRANARELLDISSSP